MTERGFQTQIYEYPMASDGVNLFKAHQDLKPTECANAQNVIFKNGMVKRGGQSAHDTDEVNAGNVIKGLHKYINTTANKTVAASGGNVYTLDSGTWTARVSGLTDTQFYFENFLDRIYMSNGTEAPRYWDGSSVTTVTAAPTTTLQMLQYQDRLLTLQANGDLDWSDSYDTTAFQGVTNTGVQVDSIAHGMAIHSAQDVNAGLQDKVLIAGGNGMYLFQGTDLRTPSTTGNYTLRRVSQIGCNAPRTMAWTPRGTCWLGKDKQIYILPFNDTRPIPIGRRVQARRQGEEGIESIPTAQLATACAIYHDGYYKISYASSGQSKNNTQLWLEIDRMSGEEGDLGPWYGPMKGQTIGVFARNDDEVLLGGDGDPNTADDKSKISMVYELHKKGDNADFVYDASAGTVRRSIVIDYWTFYNALGEEPFLKVVDNVEAELLDVLGTISFDLYDIAGAVKTGDTFSLSGSAVFWNDAFWGVEFWSDSVATRVVVPISPSPSVRRLSIRIGLTSGNDTFELYKLKVRAQQQSLGLDT